MQGIKVIPAPVSLVSVKVEYFREESYGLVHLNGKGIGSLATSYKDTILGVNRPKFTRNPRERKAWRPKTSHPLRPRPAATSRPEPTTAATLRLEPTTAAISRPEPSREPSREPSSNSRPVAPVPLSANLNTSIDFSKLIAGLHTIAGLAAHISLSPQGTP